MTLCAALTSILSLVALKPLARRTKEYSSRLAAAQATASPAGTPAMAGASE